MIAVARGSTVYPNPYFAAQFYKDSVRVTKHYYHNQRRLASAIKVDHTNSYLAGNPSVAGPSSLGPNGSNVSSPNGSGSTSTPTSYGAMVNLDGLLQGLGLVPGTNYDLSTLSQKQEIETSSSYTGVDDFRNSNSDCQGDTTCLCEADPYWAQLAGYECAQEQIMYWYHPDYLGNTELITDAAGRPYQYFLYTPWGEVLESQRQWGDFYDTRYQFNGKELDQETGNYYYGARYYDPKTSIWLSVDPMADQRPNLTPYNFVSNNPIMRVDPTGMLDDEWDYDLNTGELTWVSDKGGSETQYVNIKDGDQQVAQTSVSGDKVYAYKLKNSVFVTNTDRNFNDQTYNQNSGYEYNSEEFKLRDHYLSEDTPIRRALVSAESSGNAIPISYTGEENKDGYTVMRLKMMGAAIDQAWDVMPTSSPSVRRVGKLNIGSVGINPSVSPLKGYSGAKALTGSNSWNMFLKANTGNFSGQGWQKKAAAAYYKSKFYTP